VDDLDIALERLEKSGGTRLGKVTEFAEGKAVYCADQFGTVVELEELKVG
jgi:predicted enzyme related to lactoylglutathione lyase